MLLIAANENELSFIWRGTWLTLFLPRSPQSQVKRKEKVEKDERCNNILTGDLWEAIFRRESVHFTLMFSFGSEMSLWAMKRVRNGQLKDHLFLHWRVSIVRESDWRSKG